MKKLSNKNVEPLLERSLRLLMLFFFMTDLEKKMLETFEKNY